MTEPMDHRALIASLPASTRRDLCAQSDWPGAIRLGVHAGLVIGLGTAIGLGVPYWPALLLPQGILLVFLFTTLHEATHRTVFTRIAANTWVAGACAFVVILGPNHFRYFHLAHHRFTHDPERDPELAGAKPQGMRAYCVYLTGLADWAWRVKTLITNALDRNADAFVPPRGRARVRNEARVFLVGYAVLLGLAGETLLWVWLIPLLIGGPFLRLYLLAEHSFCPHVANMLENTRTTFTNRLVRWLAWNMPYHAEHHAYPAVPFHRLPEFHALVRGALRETQNGYASFARHYPRKSRQNAQHHFGEDHASEPHFPA